jgi:streptogramin lyase
MSGGDLSGLWQIIPGPEGNLWFLSSDGHWIGRITPEGVFTRFSLNMDELGIPSWSHLQQGADGTIWANSFSGHGLWQIDPYTGSRKAYNVFLADAIVARDGTVWSKNDSRNRIDHLNLRTGALQQYPLPSTAGHVTCCFDGITEAKNGEIWFTTSLNEYGVNPQGVRAARLDPRTGNTTFFPLPASFVETNQMLTPAADGGVWLLGGTFTSPHRVPDLPSSSRIVYPLHISPTGVVTVYRAPNEGYAFNLALAPNGDAWMTYFDPNPTVYPSTVLARLTAGGTITPVGRLPGEEPHYMTFGPDHHLWMTTDHTIERVDVS